MVREEHLQRGLEALFSGLKLSLSWRVLRAQLIGTCLTGLFWYLLFFLSQTAPMPELRVLILIVAFGGGYVLMALTAAATVYAASVEMTEEDESPWVDAAAFLRKQFLSLVVPAVGFIALFLAAMIGLLLLLWLSRLGVIGEILLSLLTVPIWVLGVTALLVLVIGVFLLPAQLILRSSPDVGLVKSFLSLTRRAGGKLLSRECAAFLGAIILTLPIILAFAAVSGFLLWLLGLVGLPHGLAAGFDRLVNFHPLALFLGGLPVVLVLGGALSLPLCFFTVTSLLNAQELGEEEPEEEEEAENGVNV